MMLAAESCAGVEVHYSPRSFNAAKLPSAQTRILPGTPEKPLELVAPVFGFVQCIVSVSFNLPPDTKLPPR